MLLITNMLNPVRRKAFEVYLPSPPPTALYQFLEHDLPLFHGIVCDLFPGVEVPYVDYGVLQVGLNIFSAACVFGVATLNILYGINVKDADTRSDGRNAQ